MVEITVDRSLEEEVPLLEGFCLAVRDVRRAKVDEQSATSLKIRRQTDLSIETVTISAAQAEAERRLILNGDQDLCLEILAAAVAVTGPLVVKAAGPPITLREGFSVGVVCEELLEGGPFPDGASSVHPLGNDPADRLLTRLEERTVEELRFALRMRTDDNGWPDPLEGMEILAASYLVQIAYQSTGNDPSERLASVGRCLQFVSERERVLAVARVRELLHEESQLRRVWLRHSRGHDWLDQTSALLAALENLTTPAYSFAIHRSAFQALSDAARERQLFFSLWCVEPLWAAVSSELRSEMSDQQFQLVEHAVEAMWTEALGGRVASGDSAELALALEGIELDDASELVLALVSVIHALAGSVTVKEATHAGTVIVDAIISSVNSLGGQTEPSPPAAIAEFERQQVMIDALLGGGSLLGLREARRKQLNFER